MITECLSQRRETTDPPLVCIWLRVIELGSLTTESRKYFVSQRAVLLGRKIRMT